MKPRNTLNRLIVLTLAVALLFSFGLGASAEGILLPTPPPADPTPVPEEKSVILEPAQEEQVVGDLPDPSYLLRTTGDIHEGYLTIGENVYDARIYPVYRVGNAISDYLTSCTSSGYKWEPTDIFTGYLAYRIFGGGHNAYFVPEYGKTVLLLTEQGMPVQSMMPAPSAYEENKMLISVNDTVFQTDILNGYYILATSTMATLSSSNSDILGLRGKQLIFYTESAPYQLICVSIPEGARTGETYTVNKANVGKTDMGFVLVENYQPSNPDSRSMYGTIILSETPAIIGREKSSYSPDTYSKGLASDSDYLTIQLIYNSGNEYRGRVEGSLNDGSIRVSGTFWVVK